MMQTDGWAACRPRHSQRAILTAIAIGGLWLTAGCGGDAGMELAAGDALLSVAGQMEATLAEYHADVARFDDSRESAVIAAFVARVKANADDEPAVASHAAEFAEALRRIRADRETAWARRSAAMENVGVLREVARGLHKLAVESLTLQDELQRYLTGLIETRRRAASEAARANAGA